MPKISADSTYILNPGVVSQGLIKSMTATWKFDGEVSLEISADNGNHFTPVINGVPLSSGFVQGTSLKWKATLGADSKLKEVIVSYEDSAGTIAGFANPELADFKYRKSFSLKGSEGRTLYNYQKNIYVGESETAEKADISCDGNIAADFNDVRFVLADGQTILPCYLEKISGTAPDRTAEFFVKVPQLPAEGLILYVYYGNASASSISDPQSTFDFYEDFQGSDLNPDKWTKHVNLNGEASLSKGWLFLNNASIVSKAFQFKDGMIEYSAVAEQNPEVRLIIRDSGSGEGQDNAQVAFSSGYDGAQHCIAVGGIVKANDPLPLVAGKTLGYRVTADGGNILYERYIPESGKEQASVSYKDAQGPVQGPIGLKVGAKSLTRFHIVRVRKYVDPEPVIGSVGKEEDVQRPAASGVVLDTNGDLVVAKGAAQGYYVTNNLITPFDVRIMVPTWNAEGATVNISANAGVNYKKNCRNERYYYASRGDFVKGKDIRCRVTLTSGRSSTGPERLSLLSLQYAPGNIALLAPNGGEKAMQGQAQAILWSAWDYERAYPITIKFSKDGEKDFETIAEKVPNSGRYLWAIPVDKKFKTAHARIRVSDSYDDSVFGESEKGFSVE